jgi:hypothetical protein
MNESTRTIAYVVAATAALLIAWFATPPVDITPQQLAAANLGEPFYRDFTNPREPTGIRVVTYNEDKATSKVFSVEFKNGLWTIPSHNNYPADGAERLAKTSASVVGVTRDELRSSSAQDHEDLGVIDPLDSDTTKLKGRGQRITLFKGGEPVVDLIIGKQLRDRPGFYFVRRHDETSTYVSKLDIDLSTKFEDWVETDLLKLDRSDVTELVMNNYKVDPVRHELVQGDVNRLDREKSTDPWKLEGLDEATEELDNQKVTDMVGALDDLRLVGVRPKPPGLRADLSIDTKIVKDQLQLSAILQDMERRGFLVAPDENNTPHLYSNEGELEVGSNKGVRYTLRFGEVFVGDEMEIEAGIEADKKKAEDAKKAEEGADKKPDEKDSGKKSSRYLFVTVAYDPTLLGSKPEEPKNPEAPATEGKPAGESAEKPAEKSADDGAQEQKKKPAKPEEICGQDGDEQKGDAGADDKPAEPKPAPVAKPTDPQGSASGKTEAGSEQPKAEEKPKTAEELKLEYQQQLMKYKADLKAYEDKEKAGKEKVEELNRRFGAWYYVISAENFNKLHLSRKDLVKPKAKTLDGQSEDKPATDADGDAAASPKKDGDKPAEDTKEPPADDAAKPGNDQPQPKQPE